MFTITCATKRSDVAESLEQAPECLMDVLTWMVDFNFGDGGRVHKVAIEGDIATIVVCIPHSNHEVYDTYQGPREQMALLLQAAYSHLLITRQKDSPVSKLETEAAAAIPGTATPNAWQLPDLKCALFGGDDIKDVVKSIYLMLLGKPDRGLKFLSSQTIIGMLLSEHEELQEA